MKILIQLIIGLTLFHNPAFAQDSLRLPSTKIGKVQIEVGKILKKEYSDFLNFEDKGKFVYTSEGDCSGIIFQVLKVTDAATQLEYKGLYLSTVARSPIRLLQSYIDEDEIPSLIKYLELVLKVTKENSETQVEYIYNSNDLRIFCINDMSTKKGKENKWKCVIDLEKYSSGGNYYFKENEINIFLSKLKETFGGN